jgi:glycerophosphoryl diester phosphodiesterase
MVEIDTTMTLDGVLVVAHDRDLMKQANDPREIGQMSYRELHRIDIGRSFDEHFKGENVERLEKFLKQVRRSNMPVIVEFKHGEGTDLVEQTIALVRDLEMEKLVTLMSLNVDDVRKVQRLAPEIRAGYFVSMEIGDVRKFDVDVVGIKARHIDVRLVRDLHEFGRKVYVWTVDDPHDVLAFTEMGVDGIITNDPVGTAKVVRRFSQLTHEQRLLLRFRAFWRMLPHIGW